MLQQLALLKGFDLDGLDSAGPDFIHLVVECAQARLSPTARSSTAIRISSRCRCETLLSDAYNAERRKLVDRHGLARTAARLGRGLRRAW